MTSTPRTGWSDRVPEIDEEVVLLDAERPSGLRRSYSPLAQPSNDYGFPKLQPLHEPDQVKETRRRPW